MQEKAGELVGVRNATDEFLLLPSLSLLSSILDLDRPAQQTRTTRCNQSRLLSNRKDVKASVNVS